MSKPKRKSQKRTISETPAAPGARPAESRPSFGGGEFKPDYTHVVKDLRRIGLLAGSLILGLILLSFFLK